jgi:hypothetical protein
MQESIEEPYTFDAGWLERFMLRLHKESPELAEEILKQSEQRLEELNDKTI